MELIRLSSWAEFQAFAKNGAPIGSKFLWRGQCNCDWPLASGLDRRHLGISKGGDPSEWVYPYGGRYPISDDPEPNYAYQYSRNLYLVNFKKACVGLRGANPPVLSDDQWWALGRHYGLVTPLLDWTEKPYFAAFFALSDLFREFDSVPNRIMMNALGEEQQQVAIFRFQHDPRNKIEGLRIFRTEIHELGRNNHQRSVFTCIESNEYYELEGLLEQKGYGNILTKIILSDQALNDGLNDLRKHGIDYRLLYPDLQGAAMFANSPWETWDLEPEI